MKMLVACVLLLWPLIELGVCIQPDPCEPQACILLYDPICGSNGVTYGNECQFNFAKRCTIKDLELEHRGECDPCAIVLCAPLECEKGFIIDFDGEGCCPGRCVPDCSAVLCLIPDCPEDSQIVNPEQPCCRICETVCQLPLVTGPCEAVIPRWGFRDDECVEFTYGGCEGNDNNFESLADCIDECGPKEDPCDVLRVCTLEYNPICGSNGITYGNKCQFDAARECIGPSLTIVKYGRCDIPEECVDCALVDVICTNEKRTLTCDCRPDEVCCDDCCGGKVCQPRNDGSTCPDGSNPVNCFVSPCQFASCFAYPDATCIDNYCGGCNADWYIDGNLVDCNECPDGSDPVNCFVRPCQVATGCEAYPEATCVDNYCGGCNTDWFVNGQLVDCDVCKLPLDSGPCRGSFRRWGYRNGRCRRFTYGGCEGNGNRFSKKRKCLAACR